MKAEQNPDLAQKVLELKKEKNAVILAHYYQRPEIQDVADYIGDSLALARIAANIKDADVVVMCGVYFMAETVKLLCPDKKVLIPDADAGCSLADSCDPAELLKFKESHPDHTVVSYVNTSAAVKALTDIVVTSGNARKVIDSLPADEKIIFCPDRNLGSYINNITGRNMLLWDGACHVHEAVRVEDIARLKQLHPQAKVLVHPECDASVVAVADKAGSTAALLDYARTSDAEEFIVVTEHGILHQMRQDCPGKKFYGVDSGADCLLECKYMKLVTMEKLLRCLETEQVEVTIDPAIAERALLPIVRMLELS